MVEDSQSRFSKYFEIGWEIDDDCQHLYVSCSPSVTIEKRTNNEETLG